MVDAQTTKEFKLLFERPKEPVFVAKGEDAAAFDVPNNYLVNNFIDLIFFAFETERFFLQTDRFKPLQDQLGNRFGSDTKERITVKNIRVPDITPVLAISRFENFSLFIPKHRKLAGRLIEIFVGVRNVEDLKAVAVYARDRVNPYLFNYALSVALLHRPDTKNVDVPSFVASFPDKFVDGTVLQQAREEASIVPEGSRVSENFISSI